jgi:hypothetical protein
MDVLSSSGAVTPCSHERSRDDGLFVSYASDVPQQALDAQALGPALNIADELFGEVGALTEFPLRQSTAFAELS